MTVNQLITKLSNLREDEREYVVTLSIPALDENEECWLTRVFTDNLNKEVTLVGRDST